MDTSRRHRPTDLAAYAAVRDSLLTRIIRVLEDDARVSAAFLSGSFGCGHDDAWSDFDLHVAVADEQFDSFLAERLALYRRIGPPLLVQRPMVSDALPGASFQLVIFSGPIEVDWNIGPRSMAERPATSRMLVERAPVPLMPRPPLTADERRARVEDRLNFFWATAPIAVKYAGRGETRLAARQIDLLTQAYVSLWRLLREERGPEPYLPAANRAPEPELDAGLPRLGPVIDPPAALAVIGALCAKVAAMHPGIAALGVPVPVAMPGEVAGLIAIAGAVVREGAFVRRSYR